MKLTVHLLGQELLTIELRPSWRPRLPTPPPADDRPEPRERELTVVQDYSSRDGDIDDGPELAVVIPFGFGEEVTASCPSPRHRRGSSTSSSPSTGRPSSS